MGEVISGEQRQVGIPVGAIMHSTGLPMDVVDYVPCYRSSAGTGNAMGFVRWM